MLANLFSNKKDNIRRCIILTLGIGFCVFLLFFNNFQRVQLVNREGTSFEKGIVTEIVDENKNTQESRQKIKVKVLSGEFKGRTIEATSFYGYLYGAKCNVNTKVILNLSTSGDNYSASVYSYHREPIIYGFVGLFVLMLWAIGGKKGLKSAIGLFFTFMCILYLFIPMLYKGYSPFWSAVVVVILTTIVTMYLIDGFTVKSVSATLGTIIGVIIAGAFAAGFGYFSRISGYNVSDIEELIFIGNNTSLQIGGILFAGILIASLGAVMDVSMSVASTINEIYEKNNDLSRKELFKSGINVGRDMMGTMSNTLILAFTGGSINTLILSYSYCMQYNQVMNMYSIGIEIMQGISGSIAVILTVPLVSLITSELLTNKSILNKVRKEAV
ncbi:YibE/F family protein [Clostridium butyricum]|uniref:YibE/F family protein n=1 Tax=Clostridium butyricum TaxID=1492 RepID=UPI00374F1485